MNTVSGFIISATEGMERKVLGRLPECYMIDVLITVVGLSLVSPLIWALGNSVRGKSYYGDLGSLRQSGWGESIISKRNIGGGTRKEKLQGTISNASCFSMFQYLLSFRIYDLDSFFFKFIANLHITTFNMLLQQTIMQAFLQV